MKTYSERSEAVADKIEFLQKQRERNRKILAGTCMTLAVVILTAVLFVPFDDSPPDVSMYSNSPYYDLIQKINESTYEKPPYRNNFELLSAELKESFIKRDDKTGGAMPDGFTQVMTNTAIDYAGVGVIEGGQYVEVTDNQVAGVIETDIIKRSTEYIYYLRTRTDELELSVYSIDGENSELLGSWTTEEYGMEYSIMENDGYCYYNTVEMFLSQDARTVTLVIDGYSNDIGSFAALVNIDVSDPYRPRETGSVYLTGSYLSARMVDGSILLMSDYRMSSDIDFSDESTYLPQIGTLGDMHSIDAEGILYPDTLDSYLYTVFCKLDADSLQVQDSAAVLSYSGSVYVSEENIFATRTYSEIDDTDSQRLMTEISCIRYTGESMEYLGSVTLEGSVKDQYSMDEYEGILRVVTSINNVETQEDFDLTVSASLQRNASLYCVSLESFEVIASIEKFAPEGERAESVRFDGDYAYVCTAEVITLTDPVYFFDLSDLSNITYKDTGTIDGYSSSLVNFGDGCLMGIGYGDSWNLKIEIYGETQTGVTSLCAYDLQAIFSENYKSYLIDRENQLIGLGIMDLSKDYNEYVLLHFDGYKLNELIRVPLEGHLAQMRAVMIDGYLYLFGDGFEVVKVW